MLLKKIKVTIIVPMYNEEKYIKRCIESLCNQTYPKEKMEWLFIDGMSSDSTVDICSNYLKSTPMRILTNPDKRATYALNMGIQEANGDYIIRIDAHAEYDSRYIEKCVYYLDNTDADNVGGVANTKADGFLGCAIARVMSSRFGVGGSSFRVEKRSGYVDTVPFGAFRKSIFEKIGFFNNALPRSEDNDINARIKKSGGKIWLSDEIIFTYYCRDNLKEFLQMGIKNGNALFHTLRINKEAMRLRHYIPFLFLTSTLLLMIISISFSGASLALLIEWGLYLLLDFYFSFIKEGIYGIVTFWLFPLFHLTYGMGSLLGLFHIKVY